MWPPLNMNHYANKKSAAESMLDIALLMANTSQLKAVLEQGPTFNFYIPLITLISISLILQIVVGVLLIFIGEKHTHTDRQSMFFPDCIPLCFLGTKLRTSSCSFGYKTIF